MTQKKGPQRPRQVLFVASAIIDGELIQKEIFSPASVNPDLFTRDDAIEIFKQEYGQAPGKISMCALYQKKRALIKQMTETPGLSTIDIKKVGKRHEAEYRGWFGWAFEVEENPEMMYFVPLKEVCPDLGKKSNKLIAQTVFRSAIQFNNVNKL